MAGYWPRSFFASLWTSTSSRSINTQKKNLANIQPSSPHTWSITHTYWPCSFFCEFEDLDSISVHKHAKKKPAISTSHLVNNPYILKQWTALKAHSDWLVKLMASRFAFVTSEEIIQILLLWCILCHCFSIY